MKTFSQLLEMWEHLFSGKDYYDDHERAMDDADRLSAYHFFNPRTLEHSMKLKSHYARANKDGEHFINLYQGGSSNINRMAIHMHKYGADHIPGLTEITRFSRPEDVRKAIKDWHSGVTSEVDKKDYTARGHQRIDVIHGLDDVMTHTKTPHDMHVYTGLGFHPLRQAQVEGKKMFGIHLPAFTSTSIRPSIAVKFARQDEYIRNYDPRLAKNPEKPHKDPYHPLNKAPRNKIAHVVKIHVPSGTNGVYIGHGNDTSIAQREAEFILPRRSKLVIAGKSSHVHDVMGHEIDMPEAGVTKRVHIWHAKLVHDGSEPTRHMDEFK